MKRFHLIIFIFLLVAGCAPIEEGVYFEINGKSYQTTENMTYSYSASTAGSIPNGLIYFGVSYANSSYQFGFSTYSFKKGTYYFNEFIKPSTISVVRISLKINNSEIELPGDYQTTADPLNIGEENYVEIINFDENILEIRFSVIVKDPNYSPPGGFQIKVKNGYLKMHL